jgi:hypothetical protein
MAVDPAQAANRAAEKAQAVVDIEESISTIEKEGRQPDRWERVFIVQAISMLFRGAYGLARTDAALAVTPPSGRSLTPYLPTDPMYDAFNIAMLRHALREAEAEPVRDFPHFGPIVFTGGARA